MAPSWIPILIMKWSIGLPPKWNKNLSWCGYLVIFQGFCIDVIALNEPLNSCNGSVIVL